MDSYPHGSFDSFEYWVPMYGSMHLPAEIFKLMTYDPSTGRQYLDLYLNGLGYSTVVPIVPC